MHTISLSKIKAFTFGSLIAWTLGEVFVRLYPTWHDTFLQDIVHSKLPTDLYKPVGGFQPGERPNKVRFKHHPNTQARFVGREFDNWVYTDENGFRVASTGRVSSGDKQILLLGDSFLFAGQVPWNQSFVGHLEQQVPNVEWFNAGVDGYNTSDSLMLWKESNIDVDEVWLFFFWGNDIWENDWASRPTMKADESEEISLEGQNVLLAVLQHSRFVSRLYALWAIYTDTRFAEKKAQIEQLRDVQSLNQASKSTENALDEWALECVRQKVECRVFFVPPLEAFTEEDLSTSVIHQMSAIVPSTITSYNLFPVLEDRGIDLYFKSDPHWNAEGHQVVADWLIELYTTRQ